MKGRTPVRIAVGLRGEEKKRVPSFPDPEERLRRPRRAPDQAIMGILGVTTREEEAQIRNLQFRFEPRLVLYNRSFFTLIGGSIQEGQDLQFNVDDLIKNLQKDYDTFSHRWKERVQEIVEMMNDVIASSKQVIRTIRRQISAMRTTGEYARGAHMLGYPPSIAIVAQEEDIIAELFELDRARFSLSNWKERKRLYLEGVKKLEEETEQEAMETEGGLRRGEKGKERIGREISLYF